MHKLDKDFESGASYDSKGKETVWQQHNYMPVEGMAAKWKQFDKLQRLGSCTRMESDAKVNAAGCSIS